MYEGPNMKTENSNVMENKQTLMLSKVSRLCQRETKYCALHAT